MLVAGACRELGFIHYDKVCMRVMDRGRVGMPPANVTPLLDVNSTDRWVRLNSRSTLFQFVTELHIFFAAAAVKS